ncbi:hypothetical protein CRUP_029493 [Coryphaenoides rupestris]|nr:hypothetical protein CRUP_029493 [Coryphaenoides rupestris]
MFSSVSWTLMSGCTVVNSFHQGQSFTPRLFWMFFCTQRIASLQAGAKCLDGFFQRDHLLLSFGQELLLQPLSPAEEEEVFRAAAAGRVCFCTRISTDLRDSLRLAIFSMWLELADLQSDQEELQRSVQQLRKKGQRLGGELQDTRLHLEGQQARNHQLEKKQRRFDVELGQAQAEAKLRLEMEMQRQRQSHSKDMDSKDEEVDEIRQTCSKKLKQMEIQLEEEYEDKQKVLRDKRELDTKLLSAQDQVSLRNVEGEKKLRKDLKRTKVLLADAQIMLDHLKSNAPSKREITQLKNQLEESEFTAAAAVKARQRHGDAKIEDLPHPA